MNKRRTGAILLTALLLATSAIAATGPLKARVGSEQTRPPQASARAVVERAARSLGGRERIARIHNITMHGYGQYGYMFGGGKVTASPDAPDKFIAANEMTRVYDLDHDAFQQTERRNMLFPFLGPAFHNWLPVNMILAGDVAYDVDNGKSTRVARWSETPLFVDGVHQRRMWMMNNPAVLVRTMLDPQTKLGAVRRVDGLDVIDVTLKEGDKLTAAFLPSGLPSWVRWANPHTNLGQVNFKTYFTGWADVGDGLMLPLAYDTRHDWRNVDYMKTYVDAYDIDSKIPNLVPGPEVRAAAEPPSYPVPRITSVPVAKGIWRIDQGGTTVVEFKDHLTLFELPGNVRQAKAVLAYIRTLAPGKPITQLVLSHHHFDHVSGLRQAVAEGITIIQRPGNEAYLRSIVEHPAPEFPDDQARHPKPLKFITVDEKLRLSDSTQTLDIYWGRNNPHMADVLFGYVPSAKLVMEGDMISAAYEWQHWPDTFRQAVDHYGIDVQMVSPVHSVWPAHPNVLTRAQVEEMLKGGTERARQHCKEQDDKGVAHPGCPIQSKYY